MEEMLQKEAVIKFYQDHAPGKIVEYPAYTSTSKTKDAYDIQKGRRKASLTIHGKNGKDISIFSGFADEKEVLFDRNSRFRVLNRTAGMDGMSVEMEEIDNERRKNHLDKIRRWG